MILKCSFLKWWFFFSNWLGKSTPCGCCFSVEYFELLKWRSQTWLKTKAGGQKNFYSSCHWTLHYTDCFKNIFWHILKIVSWSVFELFDFSVQGLCFSCNSRCTEENKKNSMLLHKTTKVSLPLTHTETLNCKHQWSDHYLKQNYRVQHFLMQNITLRCFGRNWNLQKIEQGFPLMEKM